MRLRKSMVTEAEAASVRLLALKMDRGAGAQAARRPGEAAGSFWKEPSPRAAPSFASAACADF